MILLPHYCVGAQLYWANVSQKKIKKKLYWANLPLHLFYKQKLIGLGQNFFKAQEEPNQCIRTSHYYKFIDFYYCVNDFIITPLLCRRTTLLGKCLIFLILYYKSANAARVL